MKNLPSAVEIGLMPIRIRGTAPNREAVIKDNYDYQLWYETESESEANAVKIGDGIFSFGRSLRGNEL